MKLGLLKQAKENQEKIKLLYKEKDSNEQNYIRKVREIENKYYNLKSKLDDKIIAEEKPIEEQEKENKEQIELKIEELSKKVTEIKRIFEFFKIIEDKEFSKDIPTGEIIDSIRDDKFAKIDIVIVNSRKPKNCYSLRLIGYSLFGENFIKTFQGFTYERKHILDKPTKKELINYWKKNKEKIIKPINEEINSLIIEYEEAIKLYEIKEWKIAFLENRKDYYENHYSRGTEEQAYKEIIIKLVELTDNQKYKMILKKMILNELERENDR